VHELSTPASSFSIPGDPSVCHRLILGMSRTLAVRCPAALAAARLSGAEIPARALDNLGLEASLTAQLGWAMVVFR
jgi:hypothetical protein